ncbi:cytochrome c oxidase subunit 3 [Mycobacterium sp. NPDC003449]
MTYTAEMPAHAEQSRSPRLTGEVGIWVFILLDLLFFTAVFGVFMFERAKAPELFDFSRAQLHVDWGAANTVVLLTSSLTVALTIRCIRQNDFLRARGFIGGTAALGLMFIALKVFEWASEIGAGHVPTENSFFLMYFMTTGLHFIHVLIGLSVLAYMHIAIRRAEHRSDIVPPVLRRNTESGAAFWHFIDLIWVILFAIFYLSS